MAISTSGDWCRINLADVVMLAHTIEDQMETICMRILADSGPEGLSGIRRNTVVGAYAYFVLY